MAATSIPANGRYPVVTLLLLAAATAIFVLPDSGRLFVYDRGRILDGEVWRLLSGHLVHFSGSHFGYNLTLFALSGCWLEYRYSRYYLRLLLLTASAGSLYFLLFVPAMSQYGGLSGLAIANVVLLALLEIRRDAETRIFWLPVLALFTAKSMYEILSHETIFAAGGAFQVVPAIHLIGAAVAVLLFPWGRRGGVTENLPASARHG